MVSVILLPTCSRFSDLREERLALVSSDFLLFSVLGWLRNLESIPGFVLVGPRDGWCRISWVNALSCWSLSVLLKWSFFFLAKMRLTGSFVNLLSAPFDQVRSSINNNERLNIRVTLMGVPLSDKVRSHLLRTYLVEEDSKNVMEVLKLALEYWGVRGFSPRLNGGNSYAPTRPWLVKLVLCENWSDCHTWPQK